MNLKRYLAVAGAAALMLGSAVPAFAHGGPQPQPWLDADVAVVENGATSSAYTGGNTQNTTVVADRGGEVEKGVANGGSNTMTTGSASSGALAVTVANTEVGCPNCGRPARISADVALVRNGATSYADTGMNAQDKTVVADRGGEVEKGVANGGSNTMTTGRACSRSAAFTVVNTSINR